jgi:hypothetical protein
VGEELRDCYTGPPRGNTKELGYHVPKDMECVVISSNHTVTVLANTLFQVVVSNPLVPLITWT